MLKEPRITYGLPPGLELGPKPGQEPEIAFWLGLVNENGRSVGERMAAFMQLVQMGVQIEVKVADG